MRITLLHNSSAGSEDRTDDELVRTIVQAGHEVVQTASSLEELVGLQGPPACDLVVVAGGDGTVSRAACELSRWRLPFAILPFGTANNTAKALGLCGDMAELVARWDTSRRQQLDLALWQEGDSEVRFSEAAGFGIFPAVMATSKHIPRPDDTAATLERDRLLFESVIASAIAAPYQIAVDGEDCSGTYLLVEVLNISLIGPQLALSPESDPTDGRVELVLAGAAERDGLLELARTGSSDLRKLLPVRSARHIRIGCVETRHHRDGSLVQHAGSSRDVTITVDAGAVSYLVPP